MGSKNKDLEIIYNLQWKNKAGNGGDKANIIGMYDIPATTLNWEIFKSYLLKNSGTVGEDVKVTYITDSNREFPIESQTDFQIALYAFRRKARIGEVVNLKLDSDCEQPNHKNNRHSNDVETQFDNEAISIVSSCCNSEKPPEWFVTQMNKFKKSLTEEITASVSDIVSNIKPHTISQPSCYHSRKSKNENTKRRKLPLLTADISHETTKDLLKSLKLEGKLNHKLEKLENKTKKLKEKKLALLSKSSDSDGGFAGAKRRPIVQCESEDDILQMDATPVNTQETIPHMLGGEIYLHQWKVINSGKLTWNKNTNLMFTWGSKALKPLDTIVSVPHLKTGETGTVAVRLEIPNQSGQYECYFHFHHENRRFGHWLGCQVIVDSFDLKGNKSVLETSYSTTKEFMNNSDDVFNISNPITHYGDIWQGTANAFGFSCNLPSTNREVLQTEPKGCSILNMAKVVRDLSSRVEDIKLQDPTDTNCSSDSDNQSIISLPESNSSKGLPAEFVVVPDCFKIDEPLKPDIVKNVEQGQQDISATLSIASALKKEKSAETFDDNNNEDTNVQKSDETASNSSHKSDIVVVSLPETNQDTEEFACVIVDGQRVMIPQKMIKSEYLQCVDKAISSYSKGIIVPEQVKPILDTDCVEATEHVEENDFKSHCSAAGSCFSEATAERNYSRLFVFPQKCPGYEVINDTDLGDEYYAWSKSNAPLTPEPATTKPNEISSVALNKNPFSSENMPHVPNYQQTPPEERKAPSEEEIRVKFAPELFQMPQELVVEDPMNTPLPPLHSSTPHRKMTEETSTTATAPSAPPPIVHILPESLVTGAVNVARSVINRLVPQGSQQGNSTREANLQALAEMGFWNRDLNATLLARFEDDLSRVVAELVQ